MQCFLFCFRYFGDLDLFCDRLFRLFGLGWSLLWQVCTCWCQQIIALVPFVLPFWICVVFVDFVIVMVLIIQYFIYLGSNLSVFLYWIGWSYLPCSTEGTEGVCCVQLVPMALVSILEWIGPASSHWPQKPPQPEAIPRNWESQRQAKLTDNASPIEYLVNLWNSPPEDVNSNSIND